MKKLAFILTAIALVTFSSQGYAQEQYTQQKAPAAQASTATASNDMAWGIGLGALVVIVTLGAVIGATASSSPTTFSHSH